jgi:uncharacterized protein (DUF1015 family)
MLSLRAQTGPVFLTYRGRDEINDLVIRAQQQEPLYDFVAADNVAHTVWRISDEDRDLVIEAFKAVPLLYIADGHHRAASASRARAELSGNAKHDGNEEYNFFLAVLFPADQLQILPYNRIVKELNGLSASAFMAEVSRKFDVSDAASGSPEQKSRDQYVYGRQVAPLDSADGNYNPIDPLSSLDVSVLQERLLDPVLALRMFARTNELIL